MARPRKASMASITRDKLASVTVASSTSGIYEHQSLSRTSESPSSRPAKEARREHLMSTTKSDNKTMEEGGNRGHQLAKSISEARRKSFETIMISPKVYEPILMMLLSYLSQQGLAVLVGPYFENLSTVTHFPEGLWAYAVPLWKNVESLAIYYGGFDVPEAILLSLLARAPTLLFLSTFHPSISGFTLLNTLLAAFISTAFPLYFFRSSLSPQHRFNLFNSHDRHHHHHHHHHRHYQRPQEAPVDTPTYISTVLLSSSIYASTLYSSLKTFLTKFVLVHSLYPETHVIESVEKVYSTDPIAWSAHILPVGIAITDVIFARAMVESGMKPKNVQGKNFIVRSWNGLSPRMRMVIKRTTFVVVYIVGESVIKLGGIVKGGTLEGSAVVGSIWALATIVNGLVLGWIGAE